MLPSRLGPILRSLIRRRRFESEMTEEVRFHIDRRTDDLMSLEGLSRDEALRRARMEFGSPEKYKEEARQAFGVHQLDILVQDIRYGLRGLRRNPNFTAAAVLTLGLGIGATTVVFSVVDSFLLRPAPFDEPERLARIYRWSNPGTSGPFVPTAVFPLWREQTDLFEQVEAHVQRQYVVNLNGSPELLSGDSTTVGMFRFLGVQPVLGRDFAVDESSEMSSSSVTERRHGYLARPQPPSAARSESMANRTSLSASCRRTSGFPTDMSNSGLLWIFRARVPRQTCRRLSACEKGCLLRRPTNAFQRSREISIPALPKDPAIVQRASRVSTVTPQAVCWEISRTPRTYAAH